MANGVQSGWLINRADKTVEIYRQGQPVQVVSILYTFSGEDVLPRFELEV
ncbi:MAG: Uma2 family endonuclease [Microcoleaceae cyanobacterium]